MFDDADTINSVGTFKLPGAKGVADVKATIEGKFVHA